MKGVNRAEALRKLVEADLVGICDVCGMPFRREGHRKHAKRCSRACTMEAKRRAARERQRLKRSQRCEKGAQGELGARMGKL